MVNALGTNAQAAVGPAWISQAQVHEAIKDTIRERADQAREKRALAKKKTIDDCPRFGPRFGAAPVQQDGVRIVYGGTLQWTKSWTKSRIMVTILLHH